MGKLSKLQLEALEKLGRDTKQSLAFVYLGEDGTCQEVQEVEYHKVTDLDTFKQQALAYKVKKEAELKVELAKKEEALALEKKHSEEMQYLSNVTIAYLLSEMDFMKNGYPEDYEKMEVWFSNFLSDQSIAIYENATLKKYLVSSGVK